MTLALVLVLMLITRVQSPEAQSLLSTLFGGAPVPVDVAEPDNDSEETTSESELPEVDAELLAAVRDNTYFRDDDAPAWFHLLEIVRETDPDRVARESIGEVVFAQLSRQPTVYRGRVVTVVGQVIGIKQVVPAANDVGIETLYEVELRPEEDEQQRLFGYVLELPSTVPAEKIPVHAGRITGYFFKNLSYRGEEDLQIGPVLVAKSYAADVRPPPQPTAGTDQMPVWQLTLIAAGIALMVVAWIVTRSNPGKPATETNDVDFSQLDYAPTADSPAEDEHAS